ncbi:MAG: hypothetical protein WBG57_09445 [Ornithinimicrobium sp.]
MVTHIGRRGTTAAAGVVGAYGAVMVLAPSPAAGLFAALGFGMAEGGITGGPARSYVLFISGVLGAVLVGWMVLIVMVITGSETTGHSSPRRAVAVSLGAWFVLDTGFSLVVGQWQHALFNVAFLTALGLPLLVWRNECRMGTSHSHDSR